RNGNQKENTKSIPSHDTSKGTSQDKQQFSTNVANHSSAAGNSSSPSQTIPTINNGRQGHIYPQGRHTILGNNRTVQRAGHFLSRSHNTGYDIGKKLREFTGIIQQVKQVRIGKRGLRNN